LGPRLAFTTAAGVLCGDRRAGWSTGVLCVELSCEYRPVRVDRLVRGRMAEQHRPSDLRWSWGGRTALAVRQVVSIATRHQGQGRSRRGEGTQDDEAADTGSGHRRVVVGFWRFTARGYWTSIWRYLNHAFPHAPGVPHAADLDRKLDAIIKLRNCIAHHEPLGPVGPSCRQVEQILEIGAWISPDMADWWRDRTSVREALACRPCERGDIT
jgi:hypothetical protein